MRRLAAALALVCLLAASAGAESIKVLILDEDFNRVPAPGERLSLLDTKEGRLFLGYSEYSGKIEAWKGEKGLYLINELPLEEYVEGVVKAETGKDWAYEALKAQAVIVRTYVLHQKKANLDRQYNVTSTVLHQLYRGKNSDSIITAAVAATEGEVLTYGGEPIVAYYHSTSGGRTELPEEVFGRSYPYLTSVETPNNLSPYSIWTRRIPLKEIEEATGVKHLRGMEVLSLTKTGRVKELRLISNPSTADLKATDFRRMLGWKKLPSTNFSLTVNGDTAVFEGKGYGHGVGLCQWSALEMAKAGKTYREILDYFYPGAELVRYEVR
ncbi:MAG: SpoIID/LytB domain-containing protein [Thermodesulfovibrionales bacterium]